MRCHAMPPGLPAAHAPPPRRGPRPARGHPCCSPLLFTPGGRTARRAPHSRASLQRTCRAGSRRPSIIIEQTKAMARRGIARRGIAWRGVASLRRTHRSGSHVRPSRTRRAPSRRASPAPQHSGGSGLYAVLCCALICSAMLDPDKLALMFLLNQMLLFNSDRLLTDC